MGTCPYSCGLTVPRSGAKGEAITSGSWVHQDLAALGDPSYHLVILEELVEAGKLVTGHMV